MSPPRKSRLAVYRTKPLAQGSVLVVRETFRYRPKNKRGGLKRKKSAVFLQGKEYWVVSTEAAQEETGLIYLARLGHPLGFNFTPEQVGMFFLPIEKKANVEGTDEEILERYLTLAKRVRLEQERMNRLKNTRRERVARMVGSLNFTILGLKAEIEKRGIPLPEINS